MAYYGDEEWDYERRSRREDRPPVRRNVTEARHSHHFLNPNVDHGGLQRTRSQGHGPLPVVNVYTDVIQDNLQRSTPPRSRSPSPYPSSFEYRGRRDVVNNGLVDQITALEIENQRLRSRSRGRSDVGFLDRRENLYVDDILRRREEEVRAKEQKATLDEERERYKHDFEMEQMKAEQKRAAAEQAAKEAKKRAIEDYENQKREDEAAAKEAKKRAIEEYERKKREDEEDAKEEEKRIREKIEREKREKKEKEEREYEEFKRKEKEEKEKAEAKKREREEEIDEEMRKRLFNIGYTAIKVERNINDEKIKRRTTTTTTTTTTALGIVRAPTYAKVHKDYLSVDTLKYYDIPYEFDRNDTNYIIVLREMDKYETEVLFEHTRKLRDKKLLLEPPRSRPQYAWYKKRDRSSSQVRKLGIMKFDS